MPNARGGAPAALGQFTLVFHIEPFVSPTDFTERKAQNDEVRKQLSALSEQMRHIPHKFDSFLPRTDDEKKQVEEYKRLRGRLHQLPAYYFRNISFNPGRYMSRYSINDYEYQRVVDQTVRSECKQVTRRVFSVLSRYEPTPEVDDEDGDG
jgi:hypothetical protein